MSVMVLRVVVSDAAKTAIKPSVSEFRSRSLYLAIFKFAIDHARNSQSNKSVVYALRALARAGPEY
jgi:hypothetical protein